MHAGIAPGLDVEFFLLSQFSGPGPVRVGAMVGIEGKLFRLRVGMVFFQYGAGYRAVRELGLGFDGGTVVPEILVLAAPVLALVGGSQVTGRSLSVGMFVFAVEVHTKTIPLVPDKCREITKCSTRILSPDTGSTTGCRPDQRNPRISRPDS